MNEVSKNVLKAMAFGSPLGIALVIIYTAIITQAANVVTTTPESNLLLVIVILLCLQGMIRGLERWTDQTDEYYKELQEETQALKKPL